MGRVRGILLGVCFAAVALSTGVLGWVVRRGLAPVNDLTRQIEALDDSLKIDLQMQALVERLLHLARADAGQVKVRREAVNVTNAARSCWQQLEQKAHVRRLRITWSCPEDSLIETDPEQLWLVIQNLIDNAVHHADEGTEISVTAMTDETSLIWSVSNSARHLHRNDLPRMFERFWRGDSSRRHTESARYGLGLSLCRTTVGRLGGSIGATLDDQSRLTISMRLPRAQ